MKNCRGLCLISIVYLLTASPVLAQDGITADREPMYVCVPCNRKCDDLLMHEPGICQHCNMKLIKKSALKNYPSIERLKVGFYLQSGVEILDFAGPMEVFAYAGYEVFTISKTREPIFAQGILTVLPDYELSDAPEADVLVFFGGNALLPSKDKAIIDWVRSQKNTKYYFSVCSGALILAEAGLLDGQKATTFRYTLDVLEDNYPKVDVLRGVRYVDNGKVLTTAGVSAGIDGALHMVAKLKGLPDAAETAFYMEYEWTPDRGVIFTENNPYHQMYNINILEEYIGEFEASTGKTFELSLDYQKKELALKTDGQFHPVFFLEEDRFLTSHRSHLLTFKRNKADRIEGFETTEHKGFFTKLKKAQTDH